MKKMTRRSAVALGGAAALLPVTGFAQQESLPDKPLKILVGFPAGGGSDVMARLMAEALKQRTDRNVLIDNKAGASGMIAVDALKNAVPDGTTIAYVPSASIAPTLTMTAPSFDPLTDIQPITLAGTVQTAYCVSPTIGVNTLPEYIAWLKKNPTRASFGTTAMGSFTHFFGVMAGQEFGIPLEPVPYRGGLRRPHRLPGAPPRRQGEAALHLGREARDGIARHPDRHPARLSQAADPGLVRLLRTDQDVAGAGRRLGPRIARCAGGTGSPRQAHRARAGRRALDAGGVQAAPGDRRRTMEDDHRVDRL